MNQYVCHPNRSVFRVQVYAEMKTKDAQLETGSVAVHGSLVDLSERGTLAVLEFTASSVAVLEREQKCKVGIKRYGRKDSSVTFRYVKSCVKLDQGHYNRNTSNGEGTTQGPMKISFA